MQMNKHRLLVLGFFILFGCKNETPPSQHQTGETPLPLIESITTELREGDCDNGNFESKCASISLKYPSVKNGSERLKKNVANWANDFMVGMLDPSLEPDEETTLESAMQGFVEMHREMTLEMPGLPSYYTVEVTDTILMQNKEHLTLRLDSYSFTGGVHPNAFAAVATFDLENGERLRIGDLVPNIEALHALTEKKFREVHAESFAEGFDFSEGWPFKLADNIGLIEEGLFFCYVPYEVAPYAMGFTEFVITYEELKLIAD